MVQEVYFLKVCIVPFYNYINLSCKVYLIICDTSVEHLRLGFFMSLDTHNNVNLIIIIFCKKPAVYIRKGEEGDKNSLRGGEATQRTTNKEPSNQGVTKREGIKRE